MSDLELPAGRVQDYRGSNPRVILIGEAPGQREAERGEPFVGPSEVKLREFWQGTGLSRPDFYITNVIDFRPPGNEIAAVGRAELLAGAERLREKLKGIAGNVIVPTGNTALWALFDQHMAITDWRGSILQWHGRKVIPTIHPAATMRQPVLSEFCRADWKRIAMEAESPEIYLPVRRHIIDPEESEIAQWRAGLESLLSRGLTELDVLAVDVENLREQPRKLTAVGFSYDPAVSLTIPLDGLPASLPLHRRWEVVKELCGMSVPKVCQNGLTDAIKLDANGVELVEYRWDLIEMAHCLNPNDGGDTLSDDEVELGGPQIRISNKSLAVLASLYTRQPYWKHLSESPDWETRQKYNGLDACVTRELFPVLLKRLKDKGLV